MPLIAAIATPKGQGGIAIVRVSGPNALEALNSVFKPAASGSFRPWHLRHGTALDKNGEPLDDALAVFMPGPNTYTGEDIAEIHCHGSELIASEILASLLARGARQAERGEFTRRAYLNGRLDLSQAEAVAELIAAPSREAIRYGLNRLEGALGRRVNEAREKIDSLRALACLGLDFPDDEIDAPDPAAFSEATRDILKDLESLLKGRERARVMQEGCMVVLAGRVNAGKSSMLNALSGENRALVTDIPGTTRDFLETHINLDGLPVCLVDTAGLRCGKIDDPVEALGMARSDALLRDADAVVLMLDGALLGEEGSRTELPPVLEADIMEKVRERPLLVVWNKCDLCRPVSFPPKWAPNAILASAGTGENLEEVAGAIRKMLLSGETGLPAEHGLAPNGRQAEALRQAREELNALLLDIERNLNYDCWTSRLDAASAALDDLLGLGGHEELLDRIFSQFCIGK